MRDFTLQTFETGKGTPQLPFSQQETQDEQSTVTGPRSAGLHVIRSSSALSLVSDKPLLITKVPTLHVRQK